ncbi:MAG: hypothetical protein R1F54_05430 [Candidatus Zeuxoniibacter abyssi]|nr:MAG: hypothetical protein R1F54_05430 [Candidatus Persebacteraceae bacterium AB1(2)]
MPTVLRKQGLDFAQTIQTPRAVRLLSLSSAMSRPIIATLTDASLRLSQKASKVGLIIPAPAFCHPIEAFQTITDGLILHLLADFPYE